MLVKDFMEVYKMNSTSDYLHISQFDGEHYKESHILEWETRDTKLPDDVLHRKVVRIWTRPCHCSESENVYIDIE